MREQYNFRSTTWNQFKLFLFGQGESVSPEGEPAPRIQFVAQCFRVVAEAMALPDEDVENGIEECFNAA